jgi:RNA recognition motif-containing protein
MNRFLVPREEQNSSEAHLTVKKLFVAGLREGINEDHLRQHFSRYGNVMEVLIMKDRDGLLTLKRLETLLKCSQISRQTTRLCIRNIR